MHIEVVNFTGYEDNCTINYFDHKGDYVRTHVLENLQVELHINTHHNYAVTIKSCTCIYFDEMQKSGIEKTPKRHELEKIQNALRDCVDWDEWEQSNNRDIDDFMHND